MKAWPATKRVTAFFDVLCTRRVAAVPDVADAIDLADTDTVGFHVSAIIRALRRNPTAAEMSVAGPLRLCPGPAYRPVSKPRHA